MAESVATVRHEHDACLCGLPQRRLDPLGVVGKHANEQLVRHLGAAERDVPGHPLAVGGQAGVAHEQQLPKALRQDGGVVAARVELDELLDVEGHALGAILARPQRLGVGLGAEQC